MGVNVVLIIYKAIKRVNKAARSNIWFTRTVF